MINKKNYTKREKMFLLGFLLLSIAGFLIFWQFGDRAYQQFDIKFKISREEATNKSADFAKEIGCENWAQFFLKWVISNPAITCVIPATSNPAHQAENIGALRGPLPDKEMRARMVKHMETIPGFDKLQEMPAYPGKTYNGIIRRGINARTT